LRDIEAAVLQQAVGVLEDRDEELRHVVAFEGRLATEQTVRDDAERPNVRSMIDLSRVANLLRRHVVRRTEETAVAGRGERRLAGHPTALRDAEVEQLDDLLSVRLFVLEKVRRFEIAVDDAGRVSARERFTRLKDAIGDVGDRQRAFVLEALSEVATAT